MPPRSPRRAALIPLVSLAILAVTASRPPPARAEA
jgi:hypothetical protein